MENEKLNKEGKATIELMVEDGIISKECAEKYFPELKESEDERIRKQLLEMVHDFTGDSLWVDYNMHKEDAVAWLENQGEQKPIAGSKFKVGDKVVHKGTGKLWTVHWYIKENNVYSVEDSEGLIHIYSPDVLELVEQKPAEKVKPKFKVGDWVVVDDGRTGRIIECTKDFADVDLEFSCLSTRVNNIRSWTIQDAKDGDILVHSSFMFGDFIFIYNNTSILQAYCYYYSERDRFIIEDKEHLCLWDMQEVKPATKEQRDLLFQKMKEAGYEWDAEKKELKKIEQKHTDSPKGEDYGIDGLYAAVDILKKTLGKVDGYQTDDGILEHECAITAVKRLYEQKSWSEEDEAKRKFIEDELSGLIADEREIESPLTKRAKDLYSAFYWLKYIKDRVQPQSQQEWSEKDEEMLSVAIRETFGKGYLSVSEWLKSLKERYTWKPSDEQMKALWELMRYAPSLSVYTKIQESIESLYSDLKKLREE